MRVCVVGGEGGKGDGGAGGYSSAILGAGKHSKTV